MEAVVGHRALEKHAGSSNTLSWFKTEVLVTEENLRGLEQINAEWVGRGPGMLWVVWGVLNRRLDNRMRWPYHRYQDQR